MKMFKLSTAFLLAAFPLMAAAQTVTSPPPAGFNALNAAEADLLTYHVPPEPLTNGAGRAAWQAAMRSFGNRVSQTFTLGPSLFATGSTFHVSPSGTGTCTNNGTSCATAPVPGASCQYNSGTFSLGPSSGVVNSSGQCVAVGQSCTTPAGAPGCSSRSGCPGTYQSNGNCTASPAAAGSPCTTSGGASGTLTSNNTCVSDGQSCTDQNGSVGQYSSGKCVVPGAGCVTASGATGIYSPSGTCVKPGAACLVPGGGSGTYSSTGTCTGSGGGTTGTITNPPTNTKPSGGGAFVTPSMGTQDESIQAGVLVNPSTPSLFTTSAMLVQFRVPTVTRVGVSAGELAAWVGVQPLNGSNIVQAGMYWASNGATYTLYPFYAWSPSGLTHKLNGIVVNPGDTVFVEMWNVDSTDAFVYFADLTTNQSAHTTITPDVGSGATWGNGQIEWEVENPENQVSGFVTPNFYTLAMSATEAWNTTSPTNGTPANPTSGQTVVEANAESIPPTYQQFSGSFTTMNMLGNNLGLCCAVMAAPSGTGTITFTRSQTVN
jgi:hypothetical protein